ncbi:hypothetical protein ACFLWO_02505 [Chloroflexota bacterium]
MTTSPVFGTSLESVGGQNPYIPLSAVANKHASPEGARQQCIA